MTIPTKPVLKSSLSHENESKLQAALDANGVQTQTHEVAHA